MALSTTTWHHIYKIFITYHTRRILNRILLVITWTCPFYGRCSTLIHSYEWKLKDISKSSYVCNDFDIHEPPSPSKQVPKTQLFIYVSNCRKVNIPAIFILGKNGQIIKRTLEKLRLDHAVINIPVNITRTDIHKLHQPPWLVWWTHRSYVRPTKLAGVYLLHGIPGKINICKGTIKTIK